MHAALPGSCVAPAFWGHNTNSSIPHTDMGMHAALAPMQPPTAHPTRPEVLLLVAFSLTLWLLGAVSGLLLPIVLQRAASAWRSATGAVIDDADGDDSAQLAPGLQSRPLSDVDPDELLDDEPLITHTNSSHAALQQQLLAKSSSSQGLTPHWQVTDADLQRFRAAVDPVKGRLLTGDLGPGWTFIMEKEQPGRMRYLSYMRPTANDKTDYLSITIVHGTTAQEMHEFNLDDGSRVRWDPMLKKAWLLQSGKDVGNTCEQLVAYLRSFPMGFVSDRLYAGIARREFSDPQEKGCLWGVSKVVHTPVTAAWAALNFPGVTMTDDYFSAWECRTILSPWADAAADAGGEPQPACAIILFHHDDLKVPEYLARTAIKLGMWRFVQGMVGYAGKWLQQRRTRVDSFTPDPQAAGRQPAPPLTPDVAAAAAAVAHRHVPAAATAALAAGSPGQDPADVTAAAAAAAGVRPAGLAVRAARSAAHSPAGSWAGFREAEAEAGTPRVLLHSVPTAPGPLNLFPESKPGAVGGLVRQHSGDMALGQSGALVQGQGRLRRGHSLEWEPRLQSSRSSSFEGSSREPGGDSNAASGGSSQPASRWQQLMQAAGNAMQAAGNALQAAGSAVKQPVEFGRSAMGAAGGAYRQLLQAIQTPFRRVQANTTEGQQVGSTQHTQEHAGPSLLAPAGPEDSLTPTAQQQQQQQGSSSSNSSSTRGRTGLTAQGDMTAAAFSSGQHRPRKPRFTRLQRLLAAASVAAAVGAGVASYSRKRRTAAAQREEE